MSTPDTDMVSKEAGKQEYPPLPEPNMVSKLTRLAYYGDDQMRAYVDADRSARREEPKDFPPRILAMLREVAAGPFEDGNGEPLQEDAAKALEWLSREEQGEADTARLDWLTENLVDTIYLDDGRIIDVGTGHIGCIDLRISPHDLRSAIDAAIQANGGEGNA